MKTHTYVILALFAAVLRFDSGAAADYPLKPVPYYKVDMTSDFWRPRMLTQRETLVPWAFERTEPGVEHLDVPSAQRAPSRNLAFSSALMLARKAARSSA